jgi:tRNA A37 threonylcarbamoyladenosine dehydratase
MSLTTSEAFDRRFGGSRRLLGRHAEAVFNGEAWVIGIGGVGSWVAEGLARMGIGRLKLFDLDHVAESNLNRQLHATMDTIGMAKVVAMRDRIHAFHPDCKVEIIDEFVTPENWPELSAAMIPQQFVVIDACDQLRTKVALAAWARSTHGQLVCVGAAGGKRRAQDVELADLRDVTHDPLLAKLRYELRRHHGAPQDQAMKLACVFSRESVIRSQDACDVEGQTDQSLNCHGYGSAATVTGTFGLVAASAAVEMLIRQAVF